MLSIRGLQNALEDIFKNVLQETPSAKIGENDIASLSRELSQTLIREKGATLNSNDLKNPLVVKGLKSLVSEFIKTKDPNFNPNLLPKLPKNILTETSAHTIEQIEKIAELKNELALKNQENSPKPKAANRPADQEETAVFLVVYEGGVPVDVLEGVTGTKKGAAIESFVANEGVSGSEAHLFQLIEVLSENAQNYQRENSPHNIDKCPRPHSE